MREHVVISVKLGNVRTFCSLETSPSSRLQGLFPQRFQTRRSGNQRDIIVHLSFDNASSTSNIVSSTSFSGALFAGARLNLFLNCSLPIAVLPPRRQRCFFVQHSLIFFHVVSLGFALLVAMSDIIHRLDATECTQLLEVDLDFYCHCRKCTSYSPTLLSVFDFDACTPSAIGEWHLKKIDCTSL